MKYFFLAFSFLIIVVWCSSLTEQQRYDDHAYPRSWDIDLQVFLSDNAEDDSVIISGTIHWQYMWYDDLVFSWDRNIWLWSDDGNLTTFSGTWIWVVGQKTLWLSLASGSLFFGDWAIQNALFKDILDDIIKSDSLIISQEIDELSLLHLWWEWIQTKSLVRDKKKDEMTLSLWDILWEGCLLTSQSETTITCSEMLLTVTNEKVIGMYWWRELVWEYTIHLQERKEKTKINLPVIQQTLWDILVWKNQQ